MSNLTENERLVLSRAGFTDRETRLYQQKFSNLFRVNPMMTEEISACQKVKTDYHELFQRNKNLADKLTEAMKQGYKP